jgi:hypothetical protein
MSDIYNPINENTISITDKNDDPVIDSNQSCFDPITNTYIYDCTLSEDNMFISGYTDSGMKARYSYKKHRWYYGSNIGTSNLIDLSERTEEEKREIIKKSHEKAAENRENKKNFNELAKAMLEQVVSNKVISETLDDTDMMLDNTYGSLILAAMIQGAKNGSFKCAEFVRDTAGYKPESKSSIDLSADIMTDADRSLLDKLSKRIG